MLRRGWSITTLLVAIATLPALTMSVVLMISNYLTRLEEVRSDLEDRGRILAAALAETSRYGVVSGNRSALEGPLAALMDNDVSIASIEIADSDGQVLVRRARSVETSVDSKPFTYPIRSRVLGTDPFEDAASLGSNHARSVTSQPSVQAGPPIGEARVYMSPEPLIAAKREAIHQSSIFIVLVMVLSCFLGIALAQLIRGPLGRVLSSLRGIQLGSFEVQLPKDHGGDLGELQRAIVDMATELAAGRHALEDKVRVRTAELQQAVQRAELASAEKRRLVARGTEQLEEERRRIALELHDQCGGTLVGARMLVLNVLALARELGPAGSDLQRSATDLSGLIDAVYASTRTIVKQLRPEVIDTLGLRSAIGEMVQTYDSHSAGCRFLLEVREPFPDLRGQAAIVAYRLVQEALANCIKHANASIVRVDLASNAQGGTLALTISDDGVGFDESVRDPKSGLGLIGMRERVSTHGGRMTLRTAPGQGTRIELLLPLDPL